MEQYRIQNISAITKEELLTVSREFKDEGKRLGQICGTRIKNGTELMYSFDKDNILTNLKFSVTDEEEVQSITELYWPAFIYENEIHDLFGVKFKESKLDFEGRFFRLAMPTPWKTLSKKEAE
jgi:NADH:ubiquinone oxidoreductase 27 kD subunit